MGKKKEMYAPLTRWQYFTKTLYHDPSRTCSMWICGGFARRWTPWR